MSDGRKSRSGGKARGLSRHHAQPSAASERLQHGDAAGARRRSRGGGGGRKLPRLASDRYRTRLLVRPGSERADQCRGRSDGAGGSARAVLQSSGPQASRASLPGRLRRQRRRGRSLMQYRACLRHCAGSAFCELPAAVRAARHHSRRRRHLAVAATGWAGTGARVDAAGRTAAGGESGGMGLDLESRRRCEFDDGGRKTLCASIDRADVRPGLDQTGARRGRG